MSRRWKIFGYCGGYVISALNTLVGLALALIYDSHSWRWRDGCIEVIGGVKWTRSKVTGQLDVRTRIWFHPRAQTHGIATWCTRSFWGRYSCCSGGSTGS